jgi:hypothetical protein
MIKSKCIKSGNDYEKLFYLDNVTIINNKVMLIEYLL